MHWISLSHIHLTISHCLGRVSAFAKKKYLAPSTKFDLHYVRIIDKEECDFLITDE